MQTQKVLYRAPGTSSKRGAAVTVCRCLECRTCSEGALLRVSARAKLGAHVRPIHTRAASKKRNSRPRLLAHRTHTLSLRPSLRAFSSQLAGTKAPVRPLLIGRPP